MSLRWPPMDKVFPNQKSSLVLLPFPHRKLTCRSIIFSSNLNEVHLKLWMATGHRTHITKHQTQPMYYLRRPPMAHPSPRLHPTRIWLQLDALKVAMFLSCQVKIDIHLSSIYIIYILLVIFGFQFVTLVFST